MKYSENLQSVLNQIKVFQPALVEMLEKYVLSDKDSFCSDYFGKWVESQCGQVFTHKNVSLFLYKDHLTLCADALIAAVVANSVTEYDHCGWCRVEVGRISDGLTDETRLHVEAEWILSKGHGLLDRLYIC